MSDFDVSAIDPHERAQLGLYVGQAQRELEAAVDAEDWEVTHCIEDDMCAYALRWLVKHRVGPWQILRAIVEALDEDRPRYCA